jgi:hypothetical protein
MCCESDGETGKPNGECPACGEPTVDGRSKEICHYSSTDCELCEKAYCDGSC